MLFVKGCFAIVMLLDFVYSLKHIDEKCNLEIVEEILKFVLFVLIVANRGFF